MRSSCFDMEDLPWSQEEPMQSGNASAQSGGAWDGPPEEDVFAGPEEEFAILGLPSEATVRGSSPGGPSPPPSVAGTFVALRIG